MIDMTGLTGIDTNVLLRALLQDDPAHSPIAERAFARLSPDAPGFITQVTLAETYWVLSRSLKLSRRECVAIMRRLFESEALEFDDGEGVGRAIALAEEGADFGDALIQGAMELFGVDRTVTFDRRAAERLGWEYLGDEAPAPAPAA